MKSVFPVRYRFRCRRMYRVSKPYAVKGPLVYYGGRNTHVCFSFSFDDSVVQYREPELVVDKLCDPIASSSFSSEDRLNSAVMRQRNVFDDTNKPLYIRIEGYDRNIDVTREGTSEEGEDGHFDEQDNPP